MYANNAGTGYANANIFYLFLGAQPQWGYQTVHGTNPVTYDLPIPFEEAPFTVAISTGNSGNHASCGGFTKTTIVLRAGTTAGVWDTVGFFIIGCQLQWGFTNNTGRPYITFPFKFSNVFTAISCICHNGSPSEANTVYNVSISGMNIGASGGGSGKYWCAFGVAQQQWGINTGGAVRTSTLPIPFTNVFLAVASTSSEWCCPGCSATNTTVTTRAYQSNRPDVAQPNDVNWIIIGCQPQWGFSVTLSFESQLYYQHYPISFTVGPFTNILTTVSDEVNGVVYAPTTVNWYKDKFGIVCDYYSNGAYVKPTSVTFISLGI